MVDVKGSSEAGPPLVGKAGEHFVGQQWVAAAIITALRRGTGDALNQTGQQIVRRNLNIQPTLTIRPGFQVRVIVDRDLVLEPYRGGNGQAEAHDNQRR